MKQQTFLTFVVITNNKPKSENLSLKNVSQRVTHHLVEDIDHQNVLELGPATGLHYLIL